MEPWKGLDLVLWVPSRLSGPFSPSEFPFRISSTCWAFVIASLPLPHHGLRAPLQQPQHPGSCVPGLSPICPAQPWGAFPMPTSCSLPRAVCFPSWGRGEACFSSLLRNCASETHNAAVKISGSGWVCTASPLFSLEQQPPSRSRGRVPLLAVCWGRRGAGRHPRPHSRATAASGLSTEEGDGHGCLQWSSMAYSKRRPA